MEKKQEKKQMTIGDRMQIKDKAVFKSAKEVEKEAQKTNSTPKSSPEL